MSRFTNADLVKERDEFVVDEKEPASLVSARLRRSDYPFLWRVKCQECHGAIVLRGEVPTYYLKQMAQELASHTPGVRQVVNRIQVLNLADSVTSR